MQPLTQLGQRFCGQPVDAPPALRFVSDQPGVTQHLEVLGDGRTAQVEPVAEFPGGKLLARENLEQLPSYRVGQRRKDVAHATAGVIEPSHEPKYMSEKPDMSTATSFLNVHYDWERLTGSVYRCRLPFCDVTIGLVRGASGALLVDTGTTLVEAAAIDADVREIASCPVTHVVLTHKHFDHVLGSSQFAEAQVLCAPEVAEYLSSATDDLRDDALSYGAEAGEVDRAIAALQPPQRGIYDAVVDLGDRHVTITRLGGGHTTADLVVVAPAPDGQEGPIVVFTGDLVEESGDPCIDADSDLPAWPATLDRMLAVGGPDAIYVPGHGSVVDAEFVRRQRDWLQEQMGRETR
jgi:glyoxylase-like metal-dependent hydrolase (beta-lactamase superfamily II)